MSRALHPTTAPISKNEGTDKLFCLSLHFVTVPIHIRRPLLALALFSMLTHFGACSMDTPAHWLDDPAHESRHDFSPVASLINNWMEHGYYKGASLAVALNGHVIFVRSFGTHTPSTVEYIASSGKWLAAAAIMAVVDEGKLSLDDPASKWLPELGEAKGRATLRQMLAHTSGYPAYQPNGKPSDNYQTLAESAANLAPLPLDSEPGAKWNYGGLALQAAGRMAELATQKNWETIFQEKIACPLGMKDTHFTPVDIGFGHTPMLGGGARSTLNDYVRFLAMLASGGMYEGQRVLSEKSIAAMQADQVLGATLGNNFIANVRGGKHNGIYGLGEWRESEDATGRALLISSPSWAGAYPWIDKQHNVYAVFIAHVDVKAAGKDKFEAMRASAELPVLVGQVIDAEKGRK